MPWVLVHIVIQLVLYGGGDFDNVARRERVAEVLEVPEFALATKPTLTYNEIIEKIISGEIKGLWVICTNPSSFMDKQ